MIKIVVDLLGADKPQTELVSGAIRQSVRIKICMYI